jgi:hypothetical protein
MKIKCPNRKCRGFVTNIKRFETDVEWEYLEDEDRWDFGVYDVGSSFHVFCSRQCELKYTGQELSIELQRIVYPEMFKNGDK